MDLRVLLGPFYAAALCGLCVAAFAFGRRDALRATPGRLFVWSGLAAVLVGLWASSLGVGPAEWLSAATFGRLGGLALLVAAAGLVTWAARLRRWAELMLGGAPCSIEEGIAAVQQGGQPRAGVFKGKLGAEAQVVSPGGAVCAFYQAEVREPAADGGKGRLLSTERACPGLLYLQGERRTAAVAFDASAIVAPVRVHRCRTVGATGGGVGEGALVDGMPGEVLSFEQVGRVGEPCLVVGRLMRGPAEGSYVVTGAGGAPPTVVLGDSALEPGRRLARRAWALMTGAAGLAAVAAMLLGQA
jgi:hypothetical protein